jgi:hypothetical protein
MTILAIPTDTAHTQRVTIQTIPNQPIHRTRREPFLNANQTTTQTHTSGSRIERPTIAQNRKLGLTGSIESTETNSTSR